MNANEVSQDFSVVRRGYDIDQVDAFLRSSEKRIKTELTDAVSRIETLEQELAESKKREEALNLTVLAATKTKDALIGDAQTAIDEASENAKAQADKIISDAQYEAFRLVTEANKDAEQIIADANNQAAGAQEAKDELNRARHDAERIRAEASAEADSRLAAAQAEALAMLTEIKDESERLVAEREAEFAAMRRDVEHEYRDTIDKVTKLQAIAADLEQRLQLAARGALAELGDVTSQLTQELATAPQAVAPPLRQSARPPAPEAEATAPTPAVVPMQATTTSQPVDPPAAESSRPAEPASQPAAAGPSRGSFYSRRSAKLPRIGSEAANGALAAVSAMRARSRVLADEADEGARERDLAMQTA